MRTSYLEDPLMRFLSSLSLKERQTKQNSHHESPPKDTKPQKQQQCNDEGDFPSKVARRRNTKKRTQTPRSISWHWSWVAWLIRSNSVEFMFSFLIKVLIVSKCSVLFALWPPPYPHVYGWPGCIYRVTTKSVTRKSSGSQHMQGGWLQHTQGRISPFPVSNYL